MSHVTFIPAKQGLSGNGFHQQTILDLGKLRKWKF